MDSIYVAIPSFKDEYLQSTIDDLFYRAKHPERITVGCFIQIDANGNNDKILISNDYSGRVLFEYATVGQVLTIPGARLKSYQWLNSEHKYFLQLDAHSRFDQNWDVELITQYKIIQQETKKEKVLISGAIKGWGFDSVSTTTIPKAEIQWDYNQHGLKEWKEIGNHLESFSFNKPVSKRIFLESGNLTPTVEWIDKPDYSYQPSWFLFGAFTFGLSVFRLQHQIPANVFNHAEEFCNSIQAFTNGWDGYTIFYKPVYHLNRNARQLSSVFRSTAQIETPLEYNINKMQNIKNILDIFIRNTEDPIIGDKRTLNDLYNFLGYSLREVFIDFLNEAFNQVDQKILNVQGLFQNFDKIEDKENAWHILYETFWAMFVYYQKIGGIYE